MTDVDIIRPEAASAADRDVCEAIWQAASMMKILLAHLPDGMAYSLHDDEDHYDCGELAWDHLCYDCQNACKEVRAEAETVIALLESTYRSVIRGSESQAVNHSQDTEVEP